jgi:glc operon protein GlcG
MPPKAAFIIAALGAVFFGSHDTRAQQPAAPNPLDTVPEKMPFYIPYGTPVTLERAEAAIAATDGAQLASIQISEHKARAAAQFRRETKVWENGTQVNGFNYVTTLDGVIASRGGIPLVEEGKLVGAIGCSGGTGSQDEAACKVGAALFK